MSSIYKRFVEPKNKQTYNFTCSSSELEALKTKISNGEYTRIDVKCGTQLVASISSEVFKYLTFERAYTGGNYFLVNFKTALLKQNELGYSL